MRRPQQANRPHSASGGGVSRAYFKPKKSEGHRVKYPIPHNPYPHFDQKPKIYHRVSAILRERETHRELTRLLVLNERLARDYEDFYPSLKPRTNPTARQRTFNEVIADNRKWLNEKECKLSNLASSLQKSYDR